MIELENGYTIDVDEFNYILQKRYGSKGKEKNRRIGYYKNIEGALEAYFRISVTDKLMADRFTLKEAIEIMKNERDRIEHLIDSGVSV